MFRFKFDLSASGNRVVDAAIPYETADKPELYLLTNEGINKINLSDFIDRLKGNKALKEVAE